MRQGPVASQPYRYCFHGVGKAGTALELQVWCPPAESFISGKRHDLLRLVVKADGTDLALQPQHGTAWDSMVSCDRLNKEIRHRVDHDILPARPLLWYAVQQRAEPRGMC